MAKKIIFILTEGDHDSAFIYRILKANGMTTNHKIAIKDYPFPLNELIKNGVSSIPIEELNMEVARSRFLPSYIMQKDDNIASIYRIGGDSNEIVRTDFIKSINAFNISDPDAIQTLKDTQISVLFFFDADDKGIDKRIEQIKKELKLSFPASEAENIDKLANKEILLIEDINVGGFIFAEAGKDTGLLEDILIPLMKQGNEDILYTADCFLNIHEGTNLFKGKVKYDPTTKEKKKINGKTYSYKKSLIGTIGQLQVSGSSNTVCISKADYLTDEKIKSDATCVDIYDFIQKALN
jgi:5S rRNA maturation endonuclease (ribonuclease M5)